MAIKTFTTSEVLTAADTNTYLANSGLVYLQSFTLTSTTSDLNMGSAFSSTYSNYRVVVSGLQTTTQGVLGIYIGALSTGTNYYSSFNYDSAGGTVSGTIRGNGTAYMGVGLTEIGVSSNFSFDVCSPQLAQPTSYMGNYNGRVVYAGTGAGALNDNTQYTGIGFISPGGSMTAGTFTIFGYRKA
jgi:hypothetical protein